MKIVIIDFLQSSLTEAVGRRAVADGHAVVMALARLPEAGRVAGAEYVAVGSGADRAVHRALAWVGHTPMMHSTRATAALMRRIRQERADAVMLFSPQRLYVNLYLLACEMIRLDIPAVITLPEGFPVYRSMGALFRRGGFNRRALRSAFDAWEDVSLVAPSAAVAERVGEEGIACGHPLYVIDPSGQSAAQEYMDVVGGL